MRRCDSRWCIGCHCPAHASRIFNAVATGKLFDGFFHVSQEDQTVFYRYLFANVGWLFAMYAGGKLLLHMCLFDYKTGAVYVFVVIDAVGVRARSVFGCHQDANHQNVPLTRYTTLNSVLRSLLMLLW